MFWVHFAIAAVIIIGAGYKLSHYGAQIAKRTGISRTFLGIILFSTITSLPELTVCITSASVVGAPDLAVGNVFGSNLFNLLLIAVLDIVQGKGAILDRLSTGHVLAASIGILLTGLAILCIGLGLSFNLRFMGLESIILILLYVMGIKILYRHEILGSPKGIPKVQKSAEIEGGKSVYIFFAIGAIAIVGAGLWLSVTADAIAQAMGWDRSFVGSFMLAVVTSLPELAVGIPLVRMGALDMAIGSLLGSNIFNIAIIPVADIFFTRGAILANVSQNHILTAVLGIVMTNIVIIDLIYRAKKVPWRVSWGSISIISLYLLGSITLFKLGIR
ncbi:MAG: sodium:calcium antiporter [Deltaproteobacteria bacterium]|nr:sodium:calcium antiporter [Deltaproteobacteria bacterium]